MIGKAKQSIVSVKDKLDELKSNLWDDEKNEIINEFKEKGEMKIKEIVEIMNTYASIFREAGYELAAINASLGLPPEISADFKCLGMIPVERRDEVVLKMKDSKMALIILKSLFKASDFSGSIKVGKFNLKNISITLGLIPGISISLS